MIVRKIPWTRQPQYPVGIDRSNPLVAAHPRIYSLSSVWPKANLVNGSAISGVPASTVTPAGLAANFNGTSDAVTTDTSAAHTGPWTAWAVVRPAVATGVRNIFSYGAPANGAYSFQLRQNAGNYEAYQYDTADRQALDSGGLIVGATQFVAASWDGATLRIWRDFGFRGSVAVATLSRTANTLVIGRESSNVQFWSGQIQYFGFAPKVLAAAELFTLNENAHRIFHPLERRITVVVESGVTAALTGQSLSLAQGAASPTVTTGLSGQSLALAQGAVVGSVVSAITGQSIALAQGSVTAAIVAPLTGQAITLAQGTVGVAGDIVRALTGQSVGIAQGQMVAQDLRANRGGGWETYVAPRRRKTLEQYKEEYSELPYIEIVDKKEEVKAEVAQIQAEITRVQAEVEFRPDAGLITRLKAAIETQKVKLRALKWVEETKRERVEETKRERVVHDDLVYIVAYLLGDEDEDD